MRPAPSPTTGIHRARATASRACPHARQAPRRTRRPRTAARMRGRVHRRAAPSGSPAAAAAARPSPDAGCSTHRGSAIYARSSDRRRPASRPRPRFAARHGHVQRLSVPRAAARDQRERDRVSETRSHTRRSRGRSVASAAVWPARAAICAPSSSTCAIAVCNPTSCLRPAACIGRAQRALADEVRLVLADRPAQARIIGRDRAVGILADDDVALLGAQHVHGFGAVR